MGRDGRQLGNGVWEGVCYVDRDGRWGSKFQLVKGSEMSFDLRKQRATWGIIEGVSEMEQLK